MTAKTAVTITSFGYLHGAPPEAHVTLDLRQHFRDPHVSPELRHMTADDEPVRVAVLGTPGILPLIDAAAAAVRAYLSGPSAGPVAVAVGCAGGRHRAATVARTLALVLRDENEDQEVTVVDRDLSRPVVDRPTGGADAVADLGYAARSAAAMLRHAADAADTGRSIDTDLLRGTADAVTEIADRSSSRQETPTVG